MNEFDELQQDELQQNLIMYHGYLADEIMCVELVDAKNLYVKLIDGSSMLYDDVSKTVRNLPQNPNSMTEQECRNEFGYRLRKLMYMKGLNLNHISERTSIARTQLSSYINGRHTPSFYVVDKISKALGCSIDELSYR